MNDIEQFRKDFALVWKWWIARAEETAESYQAAGLAVKRRMRDVEWLRGAMAHFAKLADAIRRDLARSERIRAEMQQRRAA